MQLHATSRNARPRRARSTRSAARRALGVRNEHAEQVALMAWARLHEHRMPGLALLFAIPNGGRRDAVTGARLKAEGVRAGVPDLFLPVARRGFHGLFIELKAPGGGASPEQRGWIARLRQAGYSAEVCCGWEAAALTLTHYLED